ncbi:MAG: UPF0175 family protein [Planctomycetia bacterium]|nr:UPF0175 family protein [Planctomycetia bacterium]
MLVKKMELTVAEDILMALNEKPAEFLKNMRTFAAIKFFELGKLSLGKAAELAEMSKLDFIELLSKQGISVYNYPPEELEDDLSSIRKARKS